MINILDPKDLEDDEEYEDICEDIRLECEKFGSINSIEVPRPQQNVDDVPGLGKVFIEYSSVAECLKAFDNLSGRKFGEKIVVVSFFDPIKYMNRQF